MLLGIEIPSQMLVAGGSFLGGLLVFQVLQGLRVIRFKGRTHLKVHKVCGFLLLAGAASHALAALAFLGVIG